MSHERCRHCGIKQTRYDNEYGECIHCKTKYADWPKGSHKHEMIGVYICGGEMFKARIPIPYRSFTMEGQFFYVPLRMQLSAVLPDGPITIDRDVDDILYIRCDPVFVPRRGQSPERRDGYSAADAFTKKYLDFINYDKVLVS